ncbi:MAG TPA: hypothetical protein DEQ09_09185, partial [Bacteroidales bacterium]|nr:hypothetical protein [Bacteroidales bacterium]
MISGYNSFIRNIFIIALAFITLTPVAGQKEKKYTRQGNKNYSENSFEDSEMLYRRAIDIDPAFNKAIFNLGDALYKQEKYDEAVNNFRQLSEKGLEKEKLSGSFYNMGNSLLKSGKIEESIEAYKNALRNDPGNMEAKFNLAYAQDLLEQQQKQQQQQQDKDQQQEKNHDQQKDQNKSDNKNNKQENDQQQQEQQDHDRNNNKE